MAYHKIFKTTKTSVLIAIGVLLPAITYSEISEDLDFFDLKILPAFQELWMRGHCKSFSAFSRIEDKAEIWFNTYGKVPDEFPSELFIDNEDGTQYWAPNDEVERIPGFSNKYRFDFVVAEYDPIDDHWNWEAQGKGMFILPAVDVDENGINDIIEYEKAVEYPLEGNIEISKVLYNGDWIDVSTEGSGTLVGTISGLSDSGIRVIEAELNFPNLTDGDNLIGSDVYDSIAIDVSFREMRGEMRFRYLTKDYGELVYDLFSNASRALPIWESEEIWTYISASTFYKENNRIEVDSFDLDLEQFDTIYRGFGHTYEFIGAKAKADVKLQDGMYSSPEKVDYEDYFFVLENNPDGAKLEDLKNPKPTYMLSEWLGWITAYHYPTIYTNTHGWMLLLPGIGESRYIYDYGIRRWTYISNSRYPTMFIFGDKPGWYLFYAETSYPNRWWHSYESGENIVENEF